MKRKIFALLLTLAVVFSLFGCSSSKSRNMDRETADNSAAPVVDNADNGTDGSKDDGARRQNNDTENTGEELSSTESGASDADSNETETTGSVPNLAIQQEMVTFFQNTKEGKEWLSDYFFGAMQEESQNGQEFDPVGEEESQIEEAKPKVEWEGLSTEEKANYIKKYLRESDWLLTNGTKPEVKLANSSLTNFATFSKNTPAGIMDTIENNPKSGVTDNDWVKFYEDHFDEQTKQAVQAQTSLDVSTETDTGSDQEEPAAGEIQPTEETSKAYKPGDGYGWLSSKIKSDVDIQSRIWSDLKEEDQEVLFNEFLNSEAGAKAMEQYFMDHLDEVKTAADEAGYSDEVLARYLPFVIGGAVVLVLLVSGGVALMIMMMKKQQAQSKYAAVADDAPEPQAVAHSKYTMNPELKKLFEESPVRPVRKAETTVRQTTPHVEVHADSPRWQSETRIQNVPVQPAKPCEASVDGYYAVSQNSVESARIHLDTPLVLVKASDSPTNPPVPYVHYSDNTIALNMDYFNRVGGQLPGGQNVRAWEALMDATVQITNSFRLTTVTGGVISDAVGAAGKKIRSMNRARLNADGSIAVPGQIILE